MRHVSEATQEQFEHRHFLPTIRAGKVRVVIAAEGVTSQDRVSYPGGAVCVALSPYQYYKERNEQLEIAVDALSAAWDADEGGGFHCKRTFHRGLMVFFACVKRKWGVSLPDSRWVI